ncbi:6-phosphofructokinase [Trinickia symbiotica]|uniref:Phosphofructokinase n=1 Tax=Trinickia symbiotica TaxID=863227 RepID=A0A2N7X4V9_9BURK|nr:1-phosphofructokinase family hexose kinase [Trinickia symbiotica]PMS36654.1 phosphofructokinase [Trinickia symbiotica]PPK46082.1 6-phosphofructokinase [Trinickia symbiotica]
MAEIVTITPNPSIDLSFSVERLVDTVKLRCGEPRKDAGGGGINVARVLRRFGSECLAIHLAGGRTGLALDALLDEERVPYECIFIGNETRENVTVLEMSSRREFRFIMPGPTVTEVEWRRCLRYLDVIDPQPRYLVASGSLAQGMPCDFYARIARWAQNNCVRMVLDASGDALAAALEAGVFLVKPSLDELRELTGAPLADASEWRDAARHLVGCGRARNVALTLGGRGAILATEDRVVSLPAIPVNVVSAVGAGDSFLAAMVWALDHDANTEEALRYAIAAGCAAVMRSGTALCNPADVIHMYRESYGVMPCEVGL